MDFLFIGSVFHWSLFIFSVYSVHWFSRYIYSFRKWLLSKQKEKEGKMSNFVGDPLLWLGSYLNAAYEIGWRNIKHFIFSWSLGMLFSAYQIPYRTDEKLINEGELEAPENYSYLKIFWNFFCRMNLLPYWLEWRKNVNTKRMFINYNRLNELAIQFSDWTFVFQVTFIGNSIYMFRITKTSNHFFFYKTSLLSNNFFLTRRRFQYSGHLTAVCSLKPLETCWQLTESSDLAKQWGCSH